jgi:hypothetical protein
MSERPTNLTAQEQRMVLIALWRLRLRIRPDAADIRTVALAQAVDNAALKLGGDPKDEVYGAGGL